MAYILPQVLVKQLFSEVPLNTVKDQNCLVFGPNYQLFRYSDPAVHDKLLLGEFSSGNGIGDAAPYATEMDYPERPDGMEVDAGYAKLYAENAVVGLTDVTGFTKVPVVEKSTVSGGTNLDATITLGTGSTKYIVAGTGRNAAFKRDIVVGDTVRIKYGGKEYVSRIASLSESFEGEGIDTIRLETSFGADLLTADYGTENSDDSWTFTSLKVEFLETIPSIEIPSKRPLDGATSDGVTQWVAEDGELGKFSLYRDRKLRVINDTWDGTESVEIETADLYLEYRALDTSYADTIHSIDDISSVQSVLGEIDPDNPLALGVYKCIQNSADRLVYFMATTGNEPADYDRVLTAASKTEDVYILVPLTGDTTVIDKVKSHCLDMSSEENKLWRISFVAPDIESGYGMYEKAATIDDRGLWATITEGKNPLTGEDEKIIVEFFDKDAEGRCSRSTLTKAMSELVPGDKIRVFVGSDPYDASKVHYESYEISKVLSNHSVRLKSGPSQVYGTGHEVRVEAWHDYTYAEIATRVASQARHYMSHRVYMVFPEYAIADGKDIPGYILAVCAAGLASSVLPQQPITNVELTGIDDVPAVYQTYSRAQLNEMAEGGVFIVMQDLPGDRVYVRHQLSTERSGGNLLKSELSITKNLDSISHQLAEAFKPYIGRYNITPTLISVVKNVANGVLDDLESSTAVGLYGPQVLPDSPGITDVHQGDVLQDHLYMHIDLNLPRPFNNLELSLQVI